MKDTRELLHDAFGEISQSIDAFKSIHEATDNPFIKDMCKIRIKRLGDSKAEILANLTGCTSYGAECVESAKPI